MNDTMIEKILFQAPSSVPPPELLKRLQRGIVLPAKVQDEKICGWQSPLRRWFPALAFSIFLLSCAIVIAVQGSWTANLKKQNETLRATTANLPQLREQHAALEQALAQQEELVQLRKDNQELHQLQTQIAQLQSLSRQAQQLQDENRRLATFLNASPVTNSSAGFFDEAQHAAERIQCVNNLKQIGLAMRIWAGDHNDEYPTSLVIMSNELSTAKILICPSDPVRQSYSPSLLSWAIFQDANSSYECLAQPYDERYPQCIVAKCPIHHNYLLADGSVQQIDPAKVREVKKDGRLYLERINSGSTP